VCVLCVCECFGVLLFCVVFVFVVCVVCVRPVDCLKYGIFPPENMAKTPKSGIAPGPDASAPAGPAASGRPPGAARRAPRHRGRRRGGADSAVDGEGGDAAASTSTGHEAYSSAPAPTEPATQEAATRNPDDEYTQPDGSRMCESHGTVVKMVGVQEPSHTPPVSLHRAPVQVVLSGRVASSSGGQQAHQQRRSAGRLAGQDSHFVIQDYWKERMAQLDDDRMMHKANGGCPSEIIEPPSPC